MPSGERHEHRVGVGHGELIGERAAPVAGEQAHAVHRDRRDALCSCRCARPAGRTDAAADLKRDDHAIARLDRGDPLADGENLGDAFVSEVQRQRELRRAERDRAVQVARGGGDRVHDRPVRAGRRRGGDIAASAAALPERAISARIRGRECRTRWRALSPTVAVSRRSRCPESRSRMTGAAAAAPAREAPRSGAPIRAGDVDGSARSRSPPGSGGERASRASGSSRPVTSVSPSHRRCRRSAACRRRYAQLRSAARRSRWTGGNRRIRGGSRARRRRR